MSDSSIWLIDRTLSGATTSSQSGPGSNDNEGVLCIPKSSSITEASPSDCLMSYTGHSLREPYPSAEMQSVYSEAPDDWATQELDVHIRLGKDSRYDKIFKFFVHLVTYINPTGQDVTHGEVKLVWLQRFQTRLVV